MRTDCWSPSCRPVVFWPDSDPAHPGECDRVGARCDQRRPELHELPLRPAALHHGDSGSESGGLRPVGHHLRLLRGHGSHHVLWVCLQESGKPPLPLLLAGAEGGDGGQPITSYHRLTPLKRLCPRYILLKPYPNPASFLSNIFAFSWQNANANINQRKVTQHALHRH